LNYHPKKMLSIIKSRIKEIKASGPLKDGPQAAVLIPCFEKNNELYIVMTERSRNLPSHAGEVAFPGGKRENDDQSLVDTAIRESSEEINLNPQDVKIIGELNTLESRFGLSVTPFVAEIKADLILSPDPAEVEEIFTIPLSFFKNNPEISSKITNYKGESFDTPVFTYETHKIWGLTLAFTLNFLELLDIQFDYDL